MPSNSLPYNALSITSENNRIDHDLFKKLNLKLILQPDCNKVF